MEGMILAAGAGTRLGSITDTLPKALVEVGRRPMLGWVIERMIEAGVTRIIINTHHHEEMIRAYVADSGFSDIDFAFSPEPDGPYETGGGLFRARALFREGSPFLLHNADVLSTISLKDLLARHREATQAGRGHPVASLAVNSRDTRRSLLFDDAGLIGWENRGSDRAPDGRKMVRAPSGKVRRYSFTGIHVVDPVIFDLSQRVGAFSIISLYLDLAAAGRVIRPLDVSDREWFDVGTPERLEDARRRFGPPQHHP